MLLTSIDEVNFIVTSLFSWWPPPSRSSTAATCNVITVLIIVIHTNIDPLLLMHSFVLVDYMTNHHFITILTFHQYKFTMCFMFL